MNLAHFDNPMNKVKGYKPSLIKNVRILELEAATAVGVGLFALSVEYVGSLGVAPVVKRDIKTLLSAAVTQSKNNFFPNCRRISMDNLTLLKRPSLAR